MAANKVRLMGTAFLMGCWSSGAMAMSGACYLDRSPGGCYEQAKGLETRQKQEKAATEKQRMMEEQQASALKDQEAATAAKATQAQASKALLQY